MEKTNKTGHDYLLIILYLETRSACLYQWPALIKNGSLGYKAATGYIFSSTFLATVTEKEGAYIYHMGL